MKSSRLLEEVFVKLIREELSRLVRNRTSAGPSGVLNQNMSSQIEVLNAIHQKSVETADNTGENAKSSKGILGFFTP